MINTDTATTDDTIKIIYNGYRKLMEMKGYANFAEEAEFRLIIEYLARFAPLLEYKGG